MKKVRILFVLSVTALLIFFATTYALNIVPERVAEKKIYAEKLQKYALQLSTQNDRTALLEALINVRGLSGSEPFVEALTNRLAVLVMEACSDRRTGDEIYRVIAEIGIIANCAYPVGEKVSVVREPCITRSPLHKVHSLCLERYARERIMEAELRLNTTAPQKEPD